MAITVMTLDEQLETHLDEQLAGAVSSIYNGDAPERALAQDATVPVLIFSTSLTEGIADTFELNGAEVTIDILIVGRRRAGSAPVRVAIEATYHALHRWTPVVSGVSVGTLRRVTEATESDAEYYVVRSTYSTHITEAA